MLANTGAQRVGLNARFLCYVGGKTVSYALLGAMVGLVGAWIEVVQEGASILAWVAGIAMIMVGGHLLGWPGLALFDPPAASSGFVARFARMLKKDSVMSRLGMGLLNGLLPCGLVYAALAMALGRGSSVEAIGFMVVFGLGTIPSLWLAAQATAALSVSWRARLSQLSGWLVILFGVYTILRGTGLIAGIMGAGHAM